MLFDLTIKIVETTCNFLQNLLTDLKIDPICSLSD